MAINFSSSYINRATGRPSSEQPVERVVNPKTTAVETVKQSKESQSLQKSNQQANQVREQELNQGLNQDLNQGIVKADPQVIEQLDLFRQNQQQQNQSNRDGVFKDNPSRDAKQALSAYEGVAKANSNDEFSSLLGVDIYV